MSPLLPRFKPELILFILGSANSICVHAQSVNFDVDDLPEIVERCKKSRVKTYLTLNIIVYDNELDEARKICDAAKKAGVDALIAADIALISLRKQYWVAGTYFSAG